MTELFIPATRGLLPRRCIVISFDVESNHSATGADGKHPVIPGSVIALGAAAYLYPERLPVSGQEVAATFHQAITPTAEASPATMAFWQQHPEAYAAACHNPVTAEEAWEAFLTWVYRLALYSIQDGRGGRPVALLSSPHGFDGGHLALLGKLTATPREVPMSWHDVPETLAAHLKVPFAEAKARFKAEKPADLPHMADQDSIIQAEAFFRALGPA
jgi:hypothetical protein